MYGNFLFAARDSKTEMILLTLLFGKEVSKSRFTGSRSLVVMIGCGKNMRNSTSLRLEEPLAETHGSVEQFVVPDAVSGL
jgi:hypothetical protein